jgi:hypothetical protein
MPEEEYVVVEQPANEEALWKEEGIATPLAASGMLDSRDADTTNGRHEDTFTTHSKLDMSSRTNTSYDITGRRRVRSRSQGQTSQTSVLSSSGATLDVAASHAQNAEARAAARRERRLRRQRRRESMLREEIGAASVRLNGYKGSTNRRRAASERIVPWYLRPLVFFFPFLRDYGGFL